MIEWGVWKNGSEADKKMNIQSIKFCRMYCCGGCGEISDRDDYGIIMNVSVQLVRQSSQSSHTKSDLYFGMNGKRLLDVEGFSWESHLTFC